MSKPLRERTRAAPPLHRHKDSRRRRCRCCKAAAPSCASPCDPAACRPDQPSQGMAAVPGAGLLALLRKRSDGGADGAGVGLASVATGGAPGASPAAAAPHSASKFEARSAAVHALEHAVTAGRVVGEARQAAQGRRIPAGHSFTYDVDVHVPHEAQPQLPVSMPRWPRSAQAGLPRGGYVQGYMRWVAACSWW